MSALDDSRSSSWSPHSSLAQGHGRPRLVAAAVLLTENNELDVGEAIRMLQSVRPKLHCNKTQVQFLEAFRNQYSAE